MLAHAGREQQACGMCRGVNISGRLTKSVVIGNLRELFAGMLQDGLCDQLQSELPYPATGFQNICLVPMP